MKFFITQHAKERYVERIQNGLNSSNNLLLSILNDLNMAKDITDKIFRECPRYILALHEKYKSDISFRILQQEKKLFIVKKRPGTGTKNSQTDGLFDVLTCYNEGINYLINFKSTVLSNEEIYLKIKAIKKKNRM